MFQTTNQKRTMVISDIWQTEHHQKPVDPAVRPDFGHYTRKPGFWVGQIFGPLSAWTISVKSKKLTWQNTSQHTSVCLKACAGLFRGRDIIKPCAAWFATQRTKLRPISSSLTLEDTSRCCFSWFPRFWTSVSRELSSPNRLRGRCKGGRCMDKYG